MLQLPEEDLIPVLQNQTLSASVLEV